MPYSAEKGEDIKHPVASLGSRQSTAEAEHRRYTLLDALHLAEELAGDLLARQPDGLRPGDRLCRDADDILERLVAVGDLGFVGREGRPGQARAQQVFGV